jgi:hypothetical protein
METLSKRYMCTEVDDISLINAYGCVLLGSVLMPSNVHNFSNIFTNTLYNRFWMRKSIYYVGLEFGPRKWF